MNYLTVENVSKSFGENILFENLSFHIDKGQKVAFVARNGTGKSTLLKIIIGDESPEGEHAKLKVHKDVKLGYLDQSPELDESLTVLECVLDTENDTLNAIRRYEMCLLQPDKPEALQKALEKMDELKAWDYEVKIKQILSKLNITNLDQRIGTLSGGQQKRVAMARILIDEPDFLILDEPTNHLDLEMIEWLEGYLDKTKITLLMVTHDRYFLERVCNTIIELDEGQLYRYRGNYSHFLIKKQERREHQIREVTRARSLMRGELDWMRRQPKARETKGKARIDAFYELQAKANQNIKEERMQMEIKTTRMGSKILELHNVSKGYENLKLIEKFDYKFKKNDKVGIVGKNGAGKSTLLNLLLQLEKPDGGKIVKGDTVQFGYYSQDGIQLNEQKKVIEVVRDIAEYIPLEGKGRNLTASMLLEHFLFPRDQHYSYVHKLSGGERRRLYLLTILMKNPNFLILDEPTNDLDILTLNVLEEFLMDFKGCLVIVSHDRYFMDKLVEHVFAFEGDGLIRDFPGNYSDYREKKEKEIEETPKAAAVQATKKETGEAPADGERKISREERKALNRLESQIKKLETKKTELSAKFADPNLDPADIPALAKELEEIKSQIEVKEEEWMEMVEELEG